MSLRIPLPWWSPSVYDITMDEHRGGWRFIAIRMSFKRTQWLGPRFGFIFQFDIGLGTRLNGQA